MFPQQRKLRDSAIVKVREHVGAAKIWIPKVPVPKQGCPSKVPKPGSQARFPSKFPKQGVQARFPKVPRKRLPNIPKQSSQAKFLTKVRKFPRNKSPKFLNSQGKVPKQGSQEQVPKSRFPSKVPKPSFQARFPSKVRKQGVQVSFPKFRKVPGNNCQVPKVLRKKFRSKVPRNRFRKIPKDSQRFPRTGSQAKFPKARLSEVLRNRFPSKAPKVPRKRFRRKVPKQGSQEQVPRVSKSLQEQVSKQGSKEQVPKPGS